MAQLPETLYVSFAEAFDASRRDILAADDDIQAALDAVVDITTATTSAVDIELALLSPTNTAKNATTITVNSTTNLLTAVRAINDYVITNSTSAAADVLADFVNVSVSWTRGQAPFHWCNLSTDAGYDTSTWTCEAT
tara:strand:+ start:2983 stop:3393 length:411 start_codon:yes stop_codon:yes gene_type:complete